MRGEKWGVGLTEILRRYPFPEVAHGQYLPEGIVWLDVAKPFETRAINEVVRIYYVDAAEPGVTVSKKRTIYRSRHRPMAYYIWLLNNDLEYFMRSPMPFLKAAIMLPAIAWTSGRGLGRTLGSLQTVAAKALVTIALPASLLVLIAHRLKMA